MPEEIFIIIMTVLMIGGGIAVVKSITGYLLSRSGKSDLTSSELKQLISDAVDESIQPLNDRMARLERRLPVPEHPPRLLEADTTRDIDEDAVDERPKHARP